MPLQRIFTLNADVHNYNTRARNYARKSCYTGRLSEYSFVNNGITFWTNLPDAVKNSDSIHCFSKKLKAELLA